jgi:serine/threonine protein kinase
MSTSDKKWVHPQILIDHGYTFVKRLSKALMGEIILGKKDGKQYAIKIVKRDCIKTGTNIYGNEINEDPEEEIYYLKKIHETKHFGCKYIVKLIERLEDYNNIYIVIEYLSGGDLCRWEMKHGRFKEDRLKKLFKNIALGLKAIHEAGYAHLDISLENIILHDDICKIIDFGLAKPIRNEHKAKSYHLPGKPIYTPPEIVALQSFDPKLADVFSLGVCLFIMVTGVPPWNKTTNSDKLFRDMVTHGKIPEQLMIWKMDFVTEETLDLLMKTLCYENKRITLDEVLSHPFCN